MVGTCFSHHLARRAATELLCSRWTLRGRRHRSAEAIGVCPFHRPEMRNTAAEATGLPYARIPTPKGLPLIGTALDVMMSGGAARIHEYCDRRHKELGPIYREKLGAVEAVFVADSGLIQKIYQNEGKYPMHLVPEAWTIYNEISGIKRGLFFMDGPQWMERRRSLNNVFLKPRTITDHVKVFNNVISDLLERWNKIQREEGVLVNLERELYNWSIESIGTMIFRRRLGCVSVSGELDSIHEFVNCVQQIFTESAKMSMMSPSLAYKLNLPVWRRFVKAAGRALELARDYVEDSVKDLSRNSASSQQHQDNIFSQLLLRDKISEEEIVRIVTDLFLAAADTTSHTTQWAFYLLSKHPSCQERLLEEVNSVVPAGEVINEDHLARLPYVKAVIKEALRLYPVAPFLTRILDNDISLNGYRVPAGKLILMSLFTTGRDPKHFQQPNQFRPERWLRDQEMRELVNSWACLPFGLGSRSCIGRRVAEVQMQFLVARTVQTFKLAPGTEKDIDIKMRLITTPETPVSLKLTKREAL